MRERENLHYTDYHANDDNNNNKEKKIVIHTTHLNLKKKKRRQARMWWNRASKSDSQDTPHRRESRDSGWQQHLNNRTGIMKKKWICISFSSLSMRPIIMRYRVNNIMFNKQTTALASAAKIARVSIGFEFDVEYLKKNSFSDYKHFFFCVFVFVVVVVVVFSLPLCLSFHKLLYRLVLFIVGRKQKIHHIHDDFMWTNRIEQI